MKDLLRKARVIGSERLAQATGVDQVRISRWLSAAVEPTTAAKVKAALTVGEGHSG